MKCVEPGDCVRIDIPNRDDPNYQYYGERGEVIEILRDNAGASTGDDRDSYSTVCGWPQVLRWI